VQENLFYVNAKTKIVDFLGTEFDNFPVKMQNRFLNFFPLLSNYQEEGIRYHPRIIFTNNIEGVAKHLPSPSIVQMFEDVNENMFDSRLRALIPFCKTDWFVYVQSGVERVTYGLVRNIGSLKDRSLEDILFSSLPEQRVTTKNHAILCYANTRWTVTMKSIKGNSINTNFALDVMGHSDMDNEVAGLVDAAFSKLQTTQRKLVELKTMFHNVFKSVLSDIGGTICVVVDESYRRDEIFNDGIWLKTPISLSKLFLQTNNYSEQKLIAISNLFLSMLNKDGITIIDNTGRILAFNVFVEFDALKVGNIIGGARKRAAYTVINSKRRDIIGVYFQSYDGEIFFANVKK
jgi:hypothetical protein